MTTAPPSVNGTPGSAEGEIAPSTEVPNSPKPMPLAPRQRLQGVPLRGILIFFVSLLVAGLFRSVVLMVVCIIGWTVFALIRLGLGVKKKVEEGSARRLT